MEYATCGQTDESSLDILKGIPEIELVGMERDCTLVGVKYLFQSQSAFLRRLNGAQLTCAIQLKPASHQSISMASPILTIPREYGETQGYLDVFISNTATG